MNAKKLILPILSGLILMSCGEDEMPTSLFSYSERLSMDNIKNIQTIIPSPSAHSGNNIARVDSGRDFGLAYTFNIPDSLVGKQLAVSIDAWVRTGNLDNACDIVCSVTDGRDSLYMWNGAGARNVMKAPNEWANVRSTLNIPMQASSKANMTISIIAHNAGKKSYFDVDDLNITYFEVGGR